MNARFEVVRNFLCIFTSVFRGFGRYELWVNVPAAIFQFSMVNQFIGFDCIPLNVYLYVKRAFHFGVWLEQES